MKDDNSPRTVYRAAFAATLAMLVIIPCQIVAFVVTPMPSTPEAWLQLFRDKPLAGLFHGDFFLLVNNLLIVLMYLAFWHSLKSGDRGMLQIGLLSGLLGIAAYLSSSKSFELMSLSGQFYAGTTDKSAILSATVSALEAWKGTAFIVWYVLNAIALFSISARMWKGSPYGRATAGWGLASAFFMTVPSTAGTVGLVFSLLSLIPWYVFSLRCAGVFRRLGWKDGAPGGA